MTRTLLLALCVPLLVSGCATVESSWSRVDVRALRSSAEGGDADSKRRLAELIARGVAIDADLAEASRWLRSLGADSRLSLIHI